jgi:hypothetical protein
MVMSTISVLSDTIYCESELDEIESCGPILIVIMILHVAQKNIYLYRKKLRIIVFEQRSGNTGFSNIADLDV